MNANETCKVYFVIITSKDLLTRFSFVVLGNNFNVHAQKCCKEKTLWENQKKQSHAQVSHSFKNSFMLKNMQKKLAKTKSYK